MIDLRPKLHITSIKNWINDPNGLIKFKGQYHVFMQHHPYSLVWGPMHWYHVVSDDLIHWKHLPIALKPGDEYDKDGCFSGTAIIENDRLYVVYTGFINNENIDNVIQQQCLAYSDDGINFVKLGLIIGADKLPQGYASNDFRDPKIFKSGDTFYILVAARKLDGRGRILLYKSKDILNWEFVSDILDEDSRGIMIECPDYVKELGFLMYCEQSQPVDGYMHHNENSTYYRLGEFKDNKFVSIVNGTIDYGFDFYAPQVFANENILIAWMDMWGRSQPSEPYGFAGQLTIPRRIEIKENRLWQTPITPSSGEEINFDNQYQERIKYGFYKINVKDLEEFELIVREGNNQKTTFKLENNEWVFDRSKSGVVITGNEKDEDSLYGIRRMPLLYRENHEIYIVLDEFSIELFVDGMSMTSTIYPDESSDLLTLKIKSKEMRIVRFNLE